MKKTAISLFLFLFLLIESSSAQISFNRTYFNNIFPSSGGYDVQQTYDNDYATIVNIVDTGYLFKVNQYGDSILLKKINFPLRYTLSDIINTSDSGLVLLSSTSLDGVFPTFIKVNTNGDILWTKNIGNDSIYVYGTIQAKNNDLISVGYKFQAFETYITRINALGNVLWSKLYHDGVYGSAVKEALDGGIATCTLNGIIKTNANGDSIWEKTYFPVTNPQHDRFNDIVVNSDSGYTMVDNVQNLMVPNYPKGIKLFRTNSKGDTLWTKLISDGLIASHLVISSDSGYSICGTYVDTTRDSSSVFFIKTDNKGVVQFRHYYAFATASSGWAIQNTYDGGYILSGNFEYYGAVPPPGIVLIKTDAQGNITGIPSLKDSEGGFAIYPNPVSQNLTILLKNIPPNGSTLEVYEINGQLVYSGYLHSLINTISFKQFAAGTYLAKIKNGNTEAVTKKFIKK